MAGICVEEIIDCTLCFALTTRDTLQRHIAWHARLNARTHATAAAVGLCGEAAPNVFGAGRLLCTLLHGHTGMHSDGSAHWTPPTPTPNGEPQ